MERRAMWSLRRSKEPVLRVPEKVIAPQGEPRVRVIEKIQPEKDSKGSKTANVEHVCLE
jgi:hypothetical protein